MKAYSYRRQLRTVFILECIFLFILLILAKSFWNYFCEFGVIQCLSDTRMSLLKFVFLSSLRPFFLMPQFVFFLISSTSYDFYESLIISLIGALCSISLLYLGVSFIGKKIIEPWFAFNLPKTLNFFHSQDWKIILLLRVMPFVPFDFSTVLFALLNFNFKRVIVFSLIGISPQVLIISYFRNYSDKIYTNIFFILILVFLLLLFVFISIEFFARKKNLSLWAKISNMKKEILREIYLNRRITNRHKHTPGKIPVLILYGFFSSHRSITILERILTYRGFEVISFNLGGLFGQFFTSGIIITAKKIKLKLDQHFERHKYEGINIVAHSKGGLVALWWVLQLGGYKRCKSVITLGTPFKGSYWLWLVLLTPLGFVFRDLWQMRPNSSFLRELHKSNIPSDLEIYNIYSDGDRVVKGKKGIFEVDAQNSNIHHIAMHHIGHYGFLYRRDVGDMIAKLISPDAKK